MSQGFGVKLEILEIPPFQDAGEQGNRNIQAAVIPREKPGYDLWCRPRLPAAGVAEKPGVSR